MSQRELRNKINISALVHDVSNAVVNESIVLKQMIDGEYGSTLQEIKAILGSLWQTNNRVIQLIDMYRSDRPIDRFIGVNPSWIGEFNICDLLKNVYQEYLPLAKSSGLKLHSEICEEYKYGTKVNGDAIHIYRMISNLVKNALQYTKTGDVFLKLVNQGNDLTVLIEDTGIGIKSEELANIFLPFYRTEASTNVDSSGSGLGLYIALMVASSHRLKLSVDSIVGKGTTFRVIFSYKKDKPYGLDDTMFIKIGQAHALPGRH